MQPWKCFYFSNALRTRRYFCFKSSSLHDQFVSSYLIELYKCLINQALTPADPFTRRSLNSFSDMDWSSCKLIFRNSMSFSNIEHLSLGPSARCLSMACFDFRLVKVLRCTTFSTGDSSDHRRCMTYTLAIDTVAEYHAFRWRTRKQYFLTPICIYSPYVWIVYIIRFGF